MMNTKLQAITKLWIIILSLFMSVQINAQSSAEILETGHKIDKDEFLLLKYDGDILHYDMLESLNNPVSPPNYQALKNKTILLPARKSLNVYLRPLNPLTYSHEVGSKAFIDPINEEVATALEGLGLALEKFTMELSDTSDLIGDLSLSQKSQFKNEVKDLKEMQSEIEKLKASLDSNKKEAVNQQFKKLKAMSFRDMATTKKELDEIKTEVKKIQNYFKRIKTSLDKFQETVKSKKASDFIQYQSLYLVSSMHRDLLEVYTKKHKRLTNLETCLNTVNDYYSVAKVGDADKGLEWCIPLERVVLEEDKNLEYTVKIFKSGFDLNDKQEIVKLENSESITRVILFRKFQRFVPEVAVAFAFTNFQFNEYGTATDSLDQQIVAQTSSNALRNLKVSGMVNFNYYLDNSPILPFYQLGLSAHNDSPILFTGLGIRSKLGASNRFAISGGVAFTLMNTLSTLKVGDVVSGTAAIEDDLKLSGNPEMSGYIAFQYNF